MTNRKPLRRVVARVPIHPFGPRHHEFLECGHSMTQLSDGLGRLTTPARRRCHDCAFGRPARYSPAIVQGLRRTAYAAG